MHFNADRDDSEVYINNHEDVYISTFNTHLSVCPVLLLHSHGEISQNHKTMFCSYGNIKLPCYSAYRLYVVLYIAHWYCVNTALIFTYLS